MLPLDDDLRVAAATTRVARIRLKNLAASAGIVVLACACYWLAPYNRQQLQSIYGLGELRFTGAAFLLTGGAAYILALAVYYLFEPRPERSKSLRFIGAVRGLLRPGGIRTGRGVADENRLAVLTTLLKCYFAPMMAMSLMVFLSRALESGTALLSSASFTSFRTLFDRFGFWFLLQIVLFVDVFVFTVGYLVELPRLRNEIRSVDPTLLGWAAALACYPPFNKVTGAILGSQVSDFPQFDNPTAHIALNLSLLGLMAIYASASVALGFKGSNLTHRGIVSRGPYAVVRHPAYTCKNLAWWIASIPLVFAAFAQSTFDGVQAVASVVGWSMIYVLRALTEEDHLRSVDGDYAAYAARVKFRFVPGIV